MAPEFPGFNGYRETTESRLTLLRDLKEQGMKAGRGGGRWSVGVLACGRRGPRQRARQAAQALAGGSEARPFICSYKGPVDVGRAGMRLDCCGSE